MDLVFGLLEIASNVQARDGFLVVHKSGAYASKPAERTIHGPHAVNNLHAEKRPAIQPEQLVVSDTDEGQRFPHRPVGRIDTHQEQRWVKEMT